MTDKQSKLLTQFKRKQSFSWKSMTNAAVGPKTFENHNKTFDYCANLYF